MPDASVGTATSQPAGEGIRRYGTVHVVAVALLLALACFALYSPVTNNDFVAFDDDSIIYLNPHLGSVDAKTAEWAFTTSYASRYMPVGWLAYSAVFRIFGLQPAGFHLASVVLHATNASLLFGILLCTARRLWPSPVDRCSRTLAAAGIVAAWWALHPMRTEVVAWATCLIYCIGQLLVLTAFALYLRADREPLGSWMRLALVASAGAFYNLAVLSYPSSCGCVALVMAYDLFRAHSLGGTSSERIRQFIRRLREKVLPWIVPAFLLVLHSLRVLQIPSGSLPEEVKMSTMGRMLRAPVLWTHYLLNTWWPTGLTPVDDRLIALSPSSLSVILCGLLCLGISVLAIRQLCKGRPGLLALWVAFVGILVPLSGLTTDVQFPADRYAYYAALPLGVLLFHLLQKSGRHFAIAALALGIWILAFVPTTRSQIAIWRDTEVLMRHSRSHLTKQSYLQSLLALRQARFRFEYRGDIAGANELLDEAAARGWFTADWKMLRMDLERWGPAVAASATPPVAHEHMRIGRTQASVGRGREAAEHFLAARRLAPDSTWIPDAFHLTPSPDTVESPIAATIGR